MTKRFTLEPVSEIELRDAVLRTIASAFGERPLDPDVARRSLALAECANFSTLPPFARAYLRLP
jgi:hypothetical protein